MAAAAEHLRLLFQLRKPLGGKSLKSFQFNVARACDTFNDRNGEQARDICHH